jgi:PAS domain S-box-containing protein
MDGIEAAQEILREHDIPLIFLSSDIYPDVVEKTERITSYGYVIKNSGLAVLTASIKMAFKLHDAHQTIQRTNETLRESEKLYRTLVEIADDAIALTNLQGKHIICNDAYYANLGFERADDVDLEGFARVHPDDLTIVIGGMNELFEKGRSSGEYRVKHKAGHWIHRYNKATLIKDSEGNPQAILSIIRDITERKQMEEKLEQSEKHFRTLVENSYDAITLIGSDGKRIYQSPSVTRLTGYSAEEIDNQDALINVYKDDLPALQSIYARFVSQPGKVERIEFRSVRKDGTIWWTEATATNLLEEPGVHAIVVNYRDNTEQKNIEAALKQAIIEKEMLIKEYHHRSEEGNP